MKTKDDLSIYNCSKIKKCCSFKFDYKLKGNFECMGSLTKFQETFVLSIESFYSNMSIKDIIKPDFKHAKHVLNIFNTKRLRNDHDLYVQRDTILLVYIFENFKDIGLNA